MGAGGGPPESCCGSAREVSHPGTRREKGQDDRCGELTKPPTVDSAARCHTVTRMPATALDTWLNLYDHRPHPQRGFYSDLTDSQLWRLHAVRRGHVPDLRLDLTNPGSWDSAHAVAAFVGIRTEYLAEHLRFATAANPGIPMHTPAPGSAAEEWHTHRAHMWQDLRSSP